ncbi:SMP-30/gluconolactonase/LRE family protein [Chitinophaga alhagiae]|uniref:SMP-30/gluconolactonase/LRE family protein n=1 Tax=Chitinophaga alhagiae TaxID=2203219 RepID=UPI0018E53E30|nr:SMP-30/gluconolactonase/LRE family protein [Chitinophaga alhagiae]
MFLKSQAISPLTPSNSGGSVPATVYGQTSTLAGSGTPGDADGTGAAALFNFPSGIDIDASGNVYVADFKSFRIRKATPAGVVTTLAGSDSGYVNGTGAAAKFSGPYDLAVDGAGNVFVADRYNHVVRKITAAGVVTTLAGSGTAGSADGTGTGASFNEPAGVAVDGSGNVFVSDLRNHKIRKITAAGVVTTLAGSGTAGFADGTGTAARFNFPIGITIDGAGNIFVADRTNQRIRKITPAGVVTTYAGVASAGADDGAGTAAKFNNPIGVAADAQGNIFVTDFSGQKIRKITPDQKVTTVTGCGCPGLENGTNPDSVAFRNPLGIAVAANGYLFTGDFANHVIRKTAFTGYSISARLPEGLTFNSATGVISGTPAENSPAANYVITAGNPSGSDAFTLNISVVDTNVPKIAYATPHVFRQAVTISTLLPVSRGGTVPSTGDVAVSLLAGGGASGATDGTGSGALFSKPYGVAVDVNGTVYVADRANHKIRKITAAGVVTTLAGSGVAGAADGTGVGATFNEPSGITLSPDGHLYVSDLQNHKVRRVTTAGVVTTIAGSGTLGFADGTGAAASFNYPIGITADAAGNLYVADRYNHRIRKVTPAGVVTTFAGSGAAGSTNATGTAASFNNPVGVCISPDGTLYVGDYGNHLVRKITTAGVVTTLAGSGSAGSANGTGTAASFNNPFGVSTDLGGNVYVGDYSNHKIRKITPAGVVTTLAGTGSAGSANGTGAAASFNNPAGVAADAVGYVYVADFLNNRVRKIIPTAGYILHPALPGGLTFNPLTGAISGTPYAVSPPVEYTVAAFNSAGYDVDTMRIEVLAAQPPSIAYINPAELPEGEPVTILSPINGGGMVPAEVYGAASLLAGGGAAGSTDGTGSGALFSKPYGVAVDVNGTVYVADRVNHKIRKVTAAGVVTTLAGSGVAGAADGTGAGATFNEPSGITLSPDGHLYVSDLQNHKVRRVTTAGVVTTIAGSGTLGFADGTGAAASFNYPIGITADAAGNLYVADRYNHRIRKVTPAGVVTTFAGSGAAGSTNATGTAASFNNPVGVCIAPDGTLYVGDYGNHLVRKITTAGVVTTLAGSGSAGSANGTGTAASFNNPFGVSTDLGGNVYVGDYSNHKIRKITPAGVVSTLAGSGSSGSANGTGAAASFNNPAGVTVDFMGNVFVADFTNNRIRKITATGYTITPTLPAGLSFNPASGIIAGTPTAVSPATDYIITAFNSAGRDGYVLTLSVTGGGGFMAAAKDSTVQYISLQKAADNTPAWSVYPNPVSLNTISVNIPGASAPSAWVSLHAMDGRLMYRRQENVQQNTIRIILPVKLKPGIYILSIDKLGAKKIVILE